MCRENVQKKSQKKWSVNSVMALTNERLMKPVQHLVRFHQSCHKKWRPRLAFSVLKYGG